MGCSALTCRHLPVADTANVVRVIEQLLESVAEWNSWPGQCSRQFGKRRSSALCRSCLANVPDHSCGERGPAPLPMRIEQVFLPRVDDHFRNVLGIRHVERREGTDFGERIETGTTAF